MPKLLSFFSLLAASIFNLYAQPVVNPGTPTALTLQTVANGTAGQWYVTETTANTAFTTRSKQSIITSCNGIQVVYSHILYTNSAESTAGLVPFEFRVSWENSSGQLYPVFFGGKRLVTVWPGATLLSDPLRINVTAGDYGYLRVFENRLTSTSFSTDIGEPGTLSSDQATTPWNTRINASWNLNGGIIATNVTGVNPYLLDYTDSGAGTLFATNLNVNVYEPVAILGLTTFQQNRGVAVVGDSIVAGSNDTFMNYDPLSGYGYTRRAINPYCPSIQLGVPGDRLRTWLSGASAYARPIVLPYCKYAICELGVNDIEDVPTLTQMQSYHLALWMQLKSYGLRVYQTTITPRTTSSDHFLTTANQTKNSAPKEALRIADNAWIRSMPYPLNGYIEVTDTVETARNSGVWNAPQTNSVTGTSTAGSSNSLTDNTQTWTTDQWAGYTLFDVTQNTISTITTSGANEVFILPVSPACAPGDTYQIMRTYTQDGVHPTPLMHINIATNIPAASVFLPN